MEYKGREIPDEVLGSVGGATEQMLSELTARIDYLEGELRQANMKASLHDEYHGKEFKAIAKRLEKLEQWAYQAGISIDKHEQWTRKVDMRLEKLERTCSIRVEPD